MPFGEFTNSLSALEFGHTPLAPNDNWRRDLSSPPIRLECKICQTRQSGHECILLRNAPHDRYIYCVALHRGGREAGLFSFIFVSEPHLSESVASFLVEALRLVDLALDTVGRVEQERMAFDHSANLSISEEVQALLPEIEYRAVLGERTRLAREIHDGLAQTLAFLKIEITRAEAFLSEGQPEGAARLLQGSARAVSDAYLDARQAIENLRRVPDGRLDTWLHQVAEDFEALIGQHVDVSIDLVTDFQPTAQVQMIRIVQEALTNIRKHAQATHVWLSAWENDGIAVVEVRDDGKGFVHDSVAAARFGLRGMRERAEAIGADFQIESGSQGGVTIRLLIPLEQRSAK